MPAVSFALRMPGQKTKIKHATNCFHSSYWVGAEKIFYTCPIEETLTADEVSHYIQFVKELLPDDDLKVKVGKDKVLYVLNIAKICPHSKYKVLLRLTLYRYVDEFPTVVKDLYGHRGKPLEEVFLAFQKAHYHSGYAYPWAGHAVCCKYGGYTKVPLERFWENLKNTGVASVQGHFSSDDEGTV